MSARRIIFATLLLICGFAVGVVLTGRMRATTNEVAAQAQPPATAPTGAGVTVPAATALPDFTTVAGRTVPVVANKIGRAHV